MGRDLDAIERHAVDGMMGLFPPHPNDHGRLEGWQRDKATGEKVPGRKANFTAKPSRPATERDYLWHLTAEQDEPRGIGNYGLHPDGLARWGMLDVDSSEPAAEVAVMAAVSLARANGAEPYLERSVQGRWHVWLFPAEPTPIGTMLRALQAMAAAVKARKQPAETYPASENRENRGGKYANLPYRGALTGEDGLGVTHLLDPVSLQPVSVYDLGTVRRSDARSLVDLAGCCPPPPQPRPLPADWAERSAGKRFEYACELLARLPKGSRHDGILAIAGVAATEALPLASAKARLAQLAQSCWPSEASRWEDEIDRALKTSYDALRAGRNCTGLTTLRKLCGGA